MPVTRRLDDARIERNIARADDALRRLGPQLLAMAQHLSAEASAHEMRRLGIAPPLKAPWTAAMVLHLLKRIRGRRECGLDIRPGGWDPPAPPPPKLSPAGTAEAAVQKLEEIPRRSQHAAETAKVTIGEMLEQGKSVDEMVEALNLRVPTAAGRRWKTTQVSTLAKQVRRHNDRKRLNETRAEARRIIIKGIGEGKEVREIINVLKIQVPAIAGQAWTLRHVQWLAKRFRKANRSGSLDQMEQTYS